MVDPRVLATVLIFILALVGVVVRPRGISEAVFALLGGAAVLAVGVETPTAAAGTLLAHWNLFLFFLGLMTIAAVADAAGVFDWLADQAARHSGGSARRLLINVFVLGTVLSAVLSNDATALILTPVVFTLTTRLGLPARPYVFACAFIANAASFILPVSNPINVVVLDTFPTPLSVYLAHLLPAALLAVLLNLLAFLLQFRRELRGSFAPERVGRPEAAKAAPRFFRTVAAWLVATAVLYIVATERQFPVGVVAGASGVGLAILGLLSRRIAAGRLAREISWPLFGFVAGMLVLIQALEDVGVTSLLTRLLVLGGSGAGVVFSSVATSALGANLINNLPATLVLVAAIGHIADAHLRLLLAYGTIVGADLGPNITVVGSLSTMLWLLILRRRDLEVSALDYLKVGAPVTMVMLAGSATVLWLGVR